MTQFNQLEEAIGLPELERLNLSRLRATHEIIPGGKRFLWGGKPNQVRDLDGELSGLGKKLNPLLAVEAHIMQLLGEVNHVLHEPRRFLIERDADTVRQNFGVWTSGPLTASLTGIQGQGAECMGTRLAVTYGGVAVSGKLLLHLDLDGKIQSCRATLEDLSQAQSGVVWRAGEGIEHLALESIYQTETAQPAHKARIHGLRIAAPDASQARTWAYSTDADMPGGQLQMPRWRIVGEYMDKAGD